GDGLYAPIAAASILAKTYRDELMRAHHETYPVYSWNTNMGYSTQAHLKAINAEGVTDLHRKTYAPVSNHLQLSLFNGEILPYEQDLDQAISY
ncbi:MAG: hypothetical protein M3Q97_09915, partial [Bacteroidota bacterium]|nr:hypothetical protein [Bacteroidota bacterium]